MLAWGSFMGLGNRGSGVVLGVCIFAFHTIFFFVSMLVSVANEVQGFLLFN